MVYTNFIPTIYLVGVPDVIENYRKNNDKYCVIIGKIIGKIIVP
jgi:hypothetical protein